MTSNTGQPRDPVGLHALFSNAQVRKLATHWITTPQQVLAITANEEGRSGLAKLLEVDLASLSSIINRLAGSLPSDEVDQLRRGRSGGELGVILPPGTERLRPPREEQEK